MAANSTATEVPSADTRQLRFEQGVALSLHLWPALTLAVQNSWGGSDSADKRDWLAGQVVDSFSSLKHDIVPCGESTSASTTPSANGTTANELEPDVEYVEELLLQVMFDEFEVNVDDESAFDVADEILRLRSQCARGDFDDVDRLMTRWSSRKAVEVDSLFKKAEDEEHETDWDDTDGETDEDEDMEEAPPLVVAPPKAKAQPEVDEDGFTKVTRKR